MARNGVILGAGLLVVTFFAGCLEDEGPAIDIKADHEHDHSMMVGDWSMKGSRCEEGGFVAAYNMQGKYWVEPWERADIREEIGNPKFTSLAVPLTGPATGHWHQGIKCAEVTHNGTVLKDFQFGYVGGAVKPPEFDPGGAQLHILLAGFGFQDLEPRKDLLAKTTAEITRSKESRVDWYGPAFTYAVYDDFEKGTYLSYSAVKKYRDVSERTIRFWWVVPADGARAHHDHHLGETLDASEATGFHPVYWDMKTTGGEQFTTPDSVNLGCHMGTDAHGPQGGACQHTLTNIYQHKTLELTYGGVLEDVLIKTEWIH